MNLPLVNGTSVCDGADSRCCSLTYSFLANLYSYDYFKKRKPFDFWHVVAATRILSRRSANMPLKYQQQFKILHTTKRLPTVVPQSAFEGDLLFMRSFMSITTVGKIPTPYSYFWRRIPIDVRVKATYDSYCPKQFSNLFRYIICYFFLLNLGIWDVNITDYRWLVAFNIINNMVILA